VALLAGFIVVLGVPAVCAVWLYAAPIRKTIKAVVFIAVLGALALLIYVPAYTLADVGSLELLLVVAVAWIGGFLLAPLPLGVLRRSRLAIRR
jgi:hypothetical protein